MTDQTIRPVAIVTGGRRGIGLGIATALARTGHDIVITGIGDAVSVQETLSFLRSQGGDALYLHADLSDVQRHEGTVKAILERFGRIDCLVNNAGIASVVRGDFLELEPENFDTIIDTNLKGTVFFTQAVVKAMLIPSEPSHARSIINITSVSAQSSSPERLDYCITKAGLAAFSQGLALRLAETGIAVFEVRPGIIRTDMTAAVTSKYDNLIANGLVPMRRWGQAEDIGDICAALASGSFAFATGSVIDADGGLSIPRL
ncbi:3-ketoacyl-ACP reductase [Rhizobium sp. SL42]|uniref:3-ketoacyl-ACP reductase n=1 Tax=Rhizobium sp. SL42 TaxID=2806346 RepID=UPI001F0103F2|nr:3-ketoacyl-ACP reductase [Rhizobium sp. SL42]UJW77474.1 3-ketoacyl-ACP reductase [Rhizobium sp. SL42]